MRISILFILLYFLLCTGSFGQNSDEVSVEIERVARSLNTEQKNKSAGILGLTFTNKSNSEVEVIFASTLGYPEKVLRRHKLPSTSDFTKGGDFATLHVEWFKDGTRLVDHEVKLMGRSISMKPGESEVIFLPIIMPQAAGDYDLKVCFDNRNIKELAETFGDHYAHLSRFFEYRLRKTVKVGSRPSVSVR